ncbi:MAG: sensor domain-containing diguanylate cyclase [Pirellulales bacterium]
MIKQPDEKPDVARAALELVREAVFVIDTCIDRVMDVNRAACELVGRTRRRLINSSWTALRPLLGETTLSEIDGRWMIAVVRESAAPAPEVARRDALTGLAGREALRLDAAHQGRRKSARRALFFIDLDGFKQINDRWGHAAGDKVLQVIAERLSENVRPTDLVVRYGGDEFLVLIDKVSRRRDLERLARRIARALSRPITFDNRQVILSASIGIAENKGDDRSIDALIAEADRAMYEAKYGDRRQQNLPSTSGPAADHKNLIVSKPR